MERNVKFNADKNGMVKRLMKAGRDYVAESVSEEVCREMVDNAISVEPSGRSDYPTMVFTQEGQVFFVDGELILSKKKKERGIKADEEILED